MVSKLEFNTQANCHSSVREEKVFSDRLGLKKCISDELFLRKPPQDILYPKETWSPERGLRQRRDRRTPVRNEATSQAERTSGLGWTRKMKGSARDAK